jgi:hypothetical protein
VVTRACKFLLFSCANAAPSDRPRGAGIVDACRSLLIARSYPPPCGEGRRRERSERRRGGGGRGWPLCASRYCLLDPHPGHLGNRLRRPTLPESSIRRERSPRRIGRFWGRVRERAAPVRRSQPRAIVNRCRSLLIARLRRCAAARPATPPDFALRAQSGRRRDRSASAIVPPCKFLFFPAAGAPLIAPARSPHPARPLLKFWAVAFAPGQPGPTATEISRRRNHLPRSGDWHGPCESCWVARPPAHLAAVKRPRLWGPPIQRTGE